MRSLRLKLIVTFLGISIAGTLLTTVIVRLSNERAFNELLLEQEAATFASQALAYYEGNQSWAGVEALAPVQPSPPVPGEQPGRPPPFALIDENGRVLLGNGQFPPGSVVPANALAGGIPLTVADAHVGTVVTDSQVAPARNPAEEAFAAQTNRALVLGALGATIVALILALFLARTLTQPLQELAVASRLIAGGKLHQAVPVRTRDELGELAAAFNQMSADLSHANEVRRQMTADIAHDLRTPLTVLSGYLEAMEDGTLTPTPARLQMMGQEVAVLNQLVADLRTLSLADAGQLTLNKERVSVEDLLAQVGAAHKLQAAKQAVTLQVDLTRSGVNIDLDHARMRQALANLVSNALRHTPAGGSITLGAAVASGGIQLTVSDTGTGIPESDLPHIFNRFYRGDRSRQSANGASGLGLAIARSLVNAHDGTIGVTSTLGKGTTFTIYLPGSSQINES